VSPCRDRRLIEPIASLKFRASRRADSDAASFAAPFGQSCTHSRGDSRGERDMV
jgi:hypothetical protein